MKKVSKTRKPRHFDEYGAKLADTKDKIASFVESWGEHLGMDQWDINLRYEPSPCEDSPLTLARAECSWQYMHGTITFYLPLLLDKTDKELEKTVVHEFGHFLVNEMRWQDVTGSEAAADVNIDHEERVVVGLQRAFMWVRDGAKKNKL